MAAQNTIGLEAVLLTKQFEKGLSTYLKGQKQIQGATDKTVSSATKSTNTLGNAFTSLGAKVVAFGATALGGQALLNFGVQSFQAAASAERLGNATENLGKKFGISGNEIVSAIQKSSGFTISRLDAMRQANQAMLLGIADDVPAFTRMTEIAVTLGRAMGQNAAKSVEDLSIALGRGSTEILDNLGITLKVGEANEIYATRLGKTVSQLTDTERKQAFLNEALRRGEQAMLQIGGVTNDTAAGMERVSASFSDFQVAFGGFLTQAAESSGVTATVTDGLQAWTFILGEAVPAIQAANEAIDQQETAMNTQAGSALATAQSFEEVQSAISGFTGQQNELIAGIASSTGSFDEYNAVVDKVADANAQTGGSYIALVGQLSITEQEFNQLRSAIDKENVAQEKANRARAKSAESLRMSGLAASFATVEIEEETVALDGLSEELMNNIALGQEFLSTEDKIAVMAARASDQIAVQSARMSGLAASFGAAADFTRTTPQDLVKQEEAEQKEIKAQVSIDEKAISSGINDALQAVTSAISQVSGLTFQENLPVEETFRVDEWVRRLQAVAVDGNNEWVSAITEQFGGQEFFKPFEEAVASGDLSAVQSAAQALINGESLLQLMDIEGAVAEVEELLAAQNLQEQINNAILEAIGQDGGTMPTSGGDASPILNALGLGEGTDLAAPISESIEAVDIPTIISDALGVDEEGENPLLSLLGLGEDGTFLAAIDLLTGETLPALSMAFDEFFINSSLGFENMILVTTNEIALLQNMASTSLPSVQAATLAMSTFFLAKFKEIDKQLNETTKLVEKLAKVIGSNVVESLRKATEATNDWLNAMRDAQGVFNSLRGAGGKPGQPAHNGLGFANGTAGFTVPAGFPNDSFPINVESGERVVVAPRGKSIEQVLGSSGSSVEVNITGVTISNGMDLNMFSNRVSQAVTEGMAG